jgi:hypothetical protein
MNKTPMPPVEHIKTARVEIDYTRTDKQIFAKDLTDRNNEPACYTKSKRGHKGVTLDTTWAALKELHAALGDTLSHRDVMNLFTSMGIKYHYWCMVD